MAGISESSQERYRSRFEGDPCLRLARNACNKQSALEMCLRRDIEEQLSHHYTHKIESECKPVTNQHSSGRCWIFACLNCMRQPTIKHFKLEEFEFSQNFVFFWDKMERFNYILHAFVETAKRGEEADGRLVSHLLTNPSEDGGQWAMLVNIIEKYGVVPKKCFPDTWACENSRQLSGITNNKLREYCCVLRRMVADQKSAEEIEKKIEDMMEEIFCILSVCLSTPPKTFVWEYYDKENKKYEKIGPITPRDFYHNHIKTFFNLEDKVVLVNDPRPENPYNKLYTVEFLNNMVNGIPVLYINQEVDQLKKYAADSIKDNEAVWFGCDVAKQCSWKKHGIEDLKLYDTELIFGVSMLGLNKAERLLYKESLMTHAMVLTAVSIEDEKTKKWRIENSWGDTGGNKGYLQMTDDWFSEFVYEVVVDKKYLPADILDIMKQTPKMLPAWDPMGSLA